MKKTYINPKMRVINLTESDAILNNMSLTGDPLDPNKRNDSRRDRWQDDWEEEDW